MSCFHPKGAYKNKGGNKSMAYSRLLIAKINLNHQVGHMGRSQVVAVVHMHHLVANSTKGFKKQYLEFWPWLAGALRRFQVDVLMGDFNMSLFRVAPELRSRGLPASLTAWYPWHTDFGVLMADSCGIYILKEDARCTVAVGVPAYLSGETLDVLPVKGGPGQPLPCYLPKHEAPEEKLNPSLAAVAVTGSAKDAATGDQRGLRVKEKRLAKDVWLSEGVFHKGSHFPLCAFTNNIGRRSEERFDARKERSAWLRRQAAVELSAGSRQSWQGIQQDSWNSQVWQGSDKHSWNSQDWQGSEQHSWTSQTWQGSRQQSWSSQALPASSGYSGAAGAASSSGPQSRQTALVPVVWSHRLGIDGPPLADDVAAVQQGFIDHYFHKH